MKYIFILLTVLLTSEILIGQDFLITNPNITTCDGMLYDAGGKNGDYELNKSFSTTICSGDGGNKTHIELDFVDIDLAVGDSLWFYDGMGGNGPHIGTIKNNISGGIKVRSTAANPSGCLTVRFVSNGNAGGTGWQARIQCVESCQEVNAELVSTSPPIVDGTIDLCLGQPIELHGTGSFPQNNIVYNQSLNQSDYKWDFDDGTTGNGAKVTHTFEKPGGYNITYVVYDSKGCASQNYVNCKVRVAPPPKIDVVGSLPSEICPSDTISLLSDIQNNNSYINVTPTPVVFNKKEVFSEKLFLPDGFDEYKTSINLNGFKANARITNADDIESVFVNMEHSYLLDLGVKLTCPNGNSVNLVKFGGFISDRKVVLGEPVENPDNPCDNTVTTAGVGADYTWKANAPNDTWTVEALKLPKNSTLPSDIYKSSDSFDGLIGCPINGEWTLSVTDNIACDNGWIFSWGVGFAKLNAYAVDTFQANITEYNWENNTNDIGSTKDELIISPKNPGVAASIFTVKDDFGCSYHDTVSVKVLSPKSGQCLKCNLPEPSISDISVCKGNPINLDASINNGIDNSISNLTNYPVDFNNSVSDKLMITDFYPTTVSMLNRTISSVDLNITCDNSSNIEANLISPDNKVLNLIAQGDIQNKKSFQVHFSLDANTPISSFVSSNTSYRPSGSWASLNGATTNGDWKMEVIDHSGTTKMNTLNTWNVNLKPINSLEYKWTGNNIDCNDCPDIDIEISNDENYSVAVTDSYGCSVSKSISVKAVETYKAPKPKVTEMKDGSVYFEWDPVPEINKYKVKVNDGVWKFSSGATSHVEPGFSQGDIVDFQVKSVPDEDVFCDEEIASLRVVYDGCYMVINAIEQVPVRCYGTPTGEIFVDVLVESVTLPVQYSINGGAFQNSALFPGVSSGEYFITVMDADGCTEKDTIVLLDPPPVLGNAFATDISCNGLKDGKVNSSATGGTAPYTYYWNTAPLSTFDSVAVDLGPRDYTVTIQDAEGCEVKETVTVKEPDVLVNSSVTTPPNCFGGHNGLIDVTVIGGTPDYTIKWNDGTIAEDLTNVKKGNYSYTVTDAHGCTETESIVVNEPSSSALEMTTTDILCHGLSTGTASVTPIGTAPFSYEWSNDSTVNSPNNINIPAGNYDLTVTDNEGCISYSSGVVSEPDSLSGVLSKNDILCNGDNTGDAEIAVSGGTVPYVYNWNDLMNQSTKTASNLSAGTYEVTVTDANNCTLEESVEILEPIALNIIKTQQDVSCASATNGKAKVSLSGGVPPFNILWNDANNQTTEEAVGLSVGNYTVSITDANNCLKTENFVIGINPNGVTIDSIQTVSPICNGQNTGSLTVFANGGAQPYTYLWDDPLAQIAKEANYLVGGTYSVTVTDAGNCSSTQTIVLTEPDVLDGQIKSTDVVCKDEATGVATIDVTGGVGPYNYQWNDPSYQITATASDLLAGTYTVSVQDANNCDFEKTIEILEPETSVSAVVTQDKIGCFGADENVVSVVASGGGTNYTYNWDIGSSKTTVNGISSGLHIVTVTDNVGCEAVSQIDVQELQQISAEFLYIKPNCYDSNDGKIGVNTVTGGDGNDILSNYQYAWDTDPVQNGQIAENLAGDKDYGLTITDMSGCYETFDLHLDGQEQINVGYSKNDVNCKGFKDGTINIDDVTGGLPPYTASWGSNASNSNSVSLFNLGPNTYTVTVTDANGCTSSEPIEISEPEELIVDFQIDNTNCHSDSNGKINALPVGGTAPYSFVWDNGETTQVIENLTAGNYSLSLTDKNGCSLTASREILPPYYIGANIHTNPTTCIDSKDGVLKVYPYGGFYPFQISIEDEAFSGSEVYDDLAAGTYKVHVMDSLDCAWDTLVVIDHAPVFSIDAGKDIELYFGDEKELKVLTENAVGTPEFEWTENSDEQTLSCYDCQNPKASPKSSQYYDVYAIDENGCEAEDKIKINVLNYRDIDIPSGFSPNGDGNNERLIVHGKSRFVKNVILFQVFDQWGEMVYEDRDFQLNDEDRGWDGKFRGKEMLPGVYLWRIEIEYADGYKDQFTGETNLIK